MARETIKLHGIDLTPPDNRRRLQATIGACQGIYDVAIKPRRPTRSGQQNRYFHGVICQMLADEMRHQGNADADLDTAKGYLKDRFLRTPIHEPDTARLIGHHVRETHKLSIEEMSVFIEKCIQHLEADWHMAVPDAGSIIERKT